MTPAQLKTWRHYHNLTGRKAAEMLGISYATWKRYEREGGTVPTVVEGACWALERGWRAGERPPTGDPLATA